MAVFRTTNEIVEALVDNVSEGATVSVLKGVSVPKTGYVVALKGHEFIVRADNKDHSDEVWNWVQSNINRAGVPGHFLGAWFNDEDNSIYFDVVKVVPEKAAAIALGYANRQLAIFDLNKNEEVRL